MEQGDEGAGDGPLGGGGAAEWGECSGTPKEATEVVVGHVIVRGRREVHIEYQRGRKRASEV